MKLWFERISLSVYDKVKIQIVSVKPRCYDELNSFAHTIFSAQSYPQKEDYTPRNWQNAKNHTNM